MSPRGSISSIGSETPILYKYRHFRWRFAHNRPLRLVWGEIGPNTHIAKKAKFGCRAIRLWIQGDLGFLKSEVFS